MSEDRKKPIVGFWIAITMIVVLLAYPLSFGPACWWLAMAPPGGSVVAPRVYWPIGWLAANGPSYSRNVIFWYATRGRRNRIAVPINWDDTERFSVWSRP